MEPTEYAGLLEAAFDRRARALIEEAETIGRFPRALITHLATAGIYREKWAADTTPDLAKLNLLANKLGRLGSTGIAAGISIQDSCLAVLRRFGTNQHLNELGEQAIRGENILCFAVSEYNGGSDLQNAHSTCEREGAGWRLVGRKKFVSIATVADTAILLVRERSARHGDAALFAVPMSQIEVGQPYDLVGVRCLDTAPICFDTWVPDQAMIARPGIGLAAINWSLAHERLAIAGLVTGMCQSAIELTAARMKRRTQFGATLFEQQALRLRLAELHTRVEMLRLALDGLAATTRGLDLRGAAALKVAATRLGNEVLSECMHIFGGIGYLTAHTPLGRMWQDLKMTRVAAGTDEVLWELVATSIVPDFEAYDRLIHTVE